MFQPNICSTCGTPMEWEICDFCAGAGYIDVYDLDSLLYNPGDVKQCDQCNGDGGWYQCPNYHNHLPARAVAAGGSARARLQGRGQAQAGATETNQPYRQRPRQHHASNTAGNPAGGLPAVPPARRRSVETAKTLKV